MRTICVILAAICSLLAGSVQAETMIGYTVNLPRQVLGLCIIQTNADGNGFFLDAKGLRGPETRQNWQSVNAGMAHSYFWGSTFYLGLGISKGGEYGLNGLLGVVAPLPGKFALRVGIEGQPGGYTLGLGRWF